VTEGSTPSSDPFESPSPSPRRIFRWRGLGRSPERESKVRPLREFARELACREVRTRRLVHCHGVFDLLHIGHIRHLQEARRLGDHLVVTLTPDEYVNKGPHRPAFDAQTRAEALAALECVDTVCVNEWPTAVEAIRLLEPDVFMKGMVAGSGPRDRNGAIDHEREAIERVGGRLVLTDTELHSSSALINRHTEVFDEATRAFVLALREETGAAVLVEALSQMQDKRIRIVGSRGIARALEDFCKDVALVEADEVGECALAIVAEREARLLEPAERRALRRNADVLVVDIESVDVASVDGWHDVEPDLLICNESVASAVASWFDRTVAIRASGEATVRDRVQDVRIEVPAFPVNPANFVDESGAREAFVAFASAGAVSRLGPRQTGFLGNVARSAAHTVAADTIPDSSSIFRQIDSLLK